MGALLRNCRLSLTLVVVFEGQECPSTKPGVHVNMTDHCSILPLPRTQARWCSVLCGLSGRQSFLPCSGTGPPDPYHAGIEIDRSQGPRNVEPQNRGYSDLFFQKLLAERSCLQRWRHRTRCIIIILQDNISMNYIYNIINNRHHNYHFLI